MANPVLAFYASTEWSRFWEVFLYPIKDQYLFARPIFPIPRQVKHRLLSSVSHGIVPWYGIPLSSVSVIIPWVFKHRDVNMLVSSVSILRPWCDEKSDLLSYGSGTYIAFNWENYMSLKTTGYHITCMYDSYVVVISHLSLLPCIRTRLCSDECEVTNSNSLDLYI